MEVGGKADDFLNMRAAFLESCVTPVLSSEVMVSISDYTDCLVPALFTSG